MVTGVVEAILDRTTAKGKPYRVVRIEGEGYFDWNGCASEAGVSAGDAVKMLVAPGRFPRIMSLEKTDAADDEQCGTSEGCSDVAEGSVQPADLRVRALELAVELKKNSVVSLTQLKADVVEIAEALLSWLCASEVGGAHDRQTAESEEARQ